MVQTGEAPEAIMQREGLESIRDEGAVGKIIDNAPELADATSQRAAS